MSLCVLVLVQEIMHTYDFTIIEPQITESQMYFVYQIKMMQVNFLLFMFFFTFKNDRVRNVLGMALVILTSIVVNTVYP